jgi:FixJ family two-component response regulator
MIKNIIHELHQLTKKEKNNKKAVVSVFFERKIASTQISDTSKKMKLSANEEKVKVIETYSFADTEQTLWGRLNFK